MSEDLNKTTITKEQSAQINLLTSNLHEISNKIKLMKFDELHEELKFFQYDRDGLNQQLSIAITTQKDLQGQINEQKTREQTLLQKIEGFTEQIKEQSSENSKLDKLRQQKEETIKQFEAKLEKVRSNLDFYNSKNKANAKLIADIFANDEGTSGIVKKHIEPNIKLFEEREATIENELAKMSIYLEEFVKIIIYGKSKEEKQNQRVKEFKNQAETSVRHSQVIDPNKLEKEGLLSQFAEAHNIKDGFPEKFRLGSIKQIEENLLYIRDKLEASHKVQALEKVENMKEKYATLKKEKLQLENIINMLSAKLENRERELNEKVHLLINNIHSVQKFLGKQVDNEAFIHDPNAFDRFDFAQKFADEMEDLRKIWEAKFNEDSPAITKQQEDPTQLQARYNQMEEFLLNAGYNLDQVFTAELPQITFNINENANDQNYQDEAHYSQIAPQKSRAENGQQLQADNQARNLSPSAVFNNRSKFSKVAPGLQASHLEASRLNQSSFQKKNARDNLVFKELFEKQEREKTEMEEAIKEANRKIKELRKQNLELMDTLQKKEMFSSVGQNQLTKGIGLHLLSDLRKEVRAKEQIIENLVKVNNELTEKLSALQAEKLLVLNNKKACEDMYVYFNQKATEIFLMNEKTNKIIGENARLRRFLEQLFHELFQHGKDILVLLKTAGVDFLQVVDLTQQVLNVACADQNFDPRNFRVAYMKNDFGPAKAKANRQNEDNPPQNKNSIAGDERGGNFFKDDGGQAFPPDDNNLSQAQRGASSQNDPAPKLPHLGEADWRTLDPDFLSKFNAVLMENYELRGSLELRDKTLTEIGKDLLQYKRKIKMVSNIEQKVDRLVSQNMRIKSFMLEVLAAVAKVNEGEIKVRELSNNVDISGQLLDTFIENGKKVLLNKKNAEKKAYLLQSQVNSLSVALEKVKKESSAEISGLKISIKEKDADLEVMRQFQYKVEKLEAEIKSRIAEIEKLNSEIENYRSIIDLLEKNIGTLSRTNSADTDKLRQEIEQHRAKLNNQIDERGNILTAKLSLEAEVQRLKEQIIEQAKTLKSREDQLLETRLNLENATREKSGLQDQFREKELAFEKLHIERDALESEKNSQEADLKLLRQRLQELIDKNSEFISRERENITAQANSLVLEKIARLETQLIEVQRQLGEQAYALERRDRELEDQRGKLASKTKQLMQFNKYFSTMASSKNPNKVEISRVLAQNRDLLKEIEALRYKFGQLQALYDNLQKALERQSGSPITEFKNIDGELSMAKSVFEGYIEDYGTRNKVEAIIQLYNEKIAMKETEIAQLKSKVILAENAAKKSEETCREHRMHSEELQTENEGMRQQINAMNIEIKTFKHLISELKTRNKILTEQKEDLQEEKKGLEASLHQKLSRIGEPAKNDKLEEVARPSKGEEGKGNKPADPIKTDELEESVVTHRETSNLPNKDQSALSERFRLEDA